MSTGKVLVVEDETDFRHALAAVLADEGYDVQDVAGGRQAIDLALRTQPDLVITDWILKDDIHGLNLGRVLLAIEPATRLILITGHCSGSLEGAAEDVGVDALLEKPLRFDALCATVHGVLNTEPTGWADPVLAVLRVDADHRIGYANRRAREMFTQAVCGTSPRNLADLYHPADLPDLDTAMDDWIVTSPRLRSNTFWHLRSQEPQDDGSRLVVLRHPEDPQHLYTLIIETLLGSRSIGRHHWPFEGRVLVVDPDIVTRRAAVSVLETAGAGVYEIETIDEAARLLHADKGLEFALVAYNAIDTAIDHAVRLLRKANPAVTIIGLDERNRRAEFTAGGVERFVQWPWRIEKLIEAAVGRISVCEICRLPLPLRLAGRLEAGRRWSCVGCGRQYTAVLDLEAPAYLHTNTRPASVSG